MFKEYIKKEDEYKKKEDEYVCFYLELLNFDEFKWENDYKICLKFYFYIINKENNCNYCSGGMFIYFFLFCF